jgi:ADP-L-glycero-D-manno-heptose 6-epimerase
MHTKIYDDQLIVITGAAGFIGSGVVRYLNEKGFNNLLLVDNFDEGEKWKNVLKKKYVDFIAPHELFHFLDGREKDIEAIIHLGATSETTCPDHDLYFENNYRFSVELADYALANDHRFVYASSAATYGGGERGFSDHHDALDDLEPINMYGFSKHMFDLWLKNQGVLDDVVGFKYFNIYGPNEWHKERMASMVLHMTNQILTDGKVRLFASDNPDFGDGEQCRDFFYVKDAVAMTCQLFNSDAGGIFNVGMGVPSTWNQLAKALFHALNRDVNIEYIEMPDDLKGKYQYYTCADMAKYNAYLSDNGVEALDLHTLDSGVDDYVKNHLLTATRW